MDVPKEFSERFVVVDQLVKRPNCLVYRATDSKLGDREVAVKVYVDQPGDNKEFIDSFTSEVELLRSASHPTLVPIIDGGVQDGWFYVAMELVKGTTLRDLLKDSGEPLELDLALNIVKQLADSLTEIHEKHGVHGHVDSRAVLITDDKVRLAGYYPEAIAKIQSTMTSTGRLIVEAAYIAPEQLSSTDPVDARTDVYAVSVLLFEMLTGKRPFDGDNPLQVAMRRLTENPPSPRKLNPEISPLLDAAILKGLAKNPKDRFSTMAELVDAVTGGKDAGSGDAAASGANGGSQRLQTETIATSMSTASIQHLLKKHDSSGSSSTGGARSSATITGQQAVESPRMEVAGTAMGMPATGALPASFMFLDGSRRGEKFIVEKEQIMIGSDSGCDLVVTGKGVPARYAIVVRYGDEFSVGPLSPAGLTINGEDLDVTEEIPLKRGDVLNAGNESLRFIAPGEVFTLSSATVERTIDRKQSNIGKFLPYIVGVVAIFCVAVLFLWGESKDDIKAQRAKQSQAKEKERSALVKTLLMEGDEFFKAGTLIEPVGENARQRFTQVLELDPDNAYAKRRMTEINNRVRQLAADNQRKQQYAVRIEKLLKEADSYFQKGDYISPPGKNAKASYQAVLRLDSGNEVALAKVKEIDELMSSMLEKVNGYLAQAREYMKKGQYVVPRDANAFALVKKVLEIDPGNEDATDALYDMAATSVFTGDRAKAKGKTKAMRRWYLTAQAIGVNPDFINERLKAVGVLSRAKKSRTIIIDRGGKTVKEARTGDGRYLDTTEIEQRIDSLTLNARLTGDNDDVKVIDLSDR